MARFLVIHSIQKDEVIEKKWKENQRNKSRQNGEQARKKHIHNAGKYKQNILIFCKIRL